MSRAESIDEVLALYEAHAADPYDEEITQLDHALQTAALAAADHAPDELVVAALLHDVGHLLQLAEGRPHRHDDPVDHRHEARGARYLAGVFGPAVTGPVALHVRAKRYRCAVDPSYLRGLSAGSRASLARQGGPMDADEQATFESLPGFAAAVRLRGWDDGGKVEGLVVESMAAYRPLLERVAARGA